VKERAAMTGAKPRQYVGELDATQIAHGMNLARRNAQRLFEDASKLLEYQRFPSAASLAALSIEESGKLKVLRFLAMAPNDAVRRQAWRDYRLHRSKNTMWIVPELYAEGARTLEELGAAADPRGEHATTLDVVKQLGFSRTASTTPIGAIL
jgi:AbiV family abortive infection protein